MNNKQQAIKTRQIKENDTTDAYTTALIERDETSQRIQSAQLLLHNYLRPHEARRLNDALAGQLPGMQIVILEQWFDWTLAREAVIKANARVKQNYEKCLLLDWALWDLEKAVRNARGLGLIVITCKMSGSAVSVELPAQCIL